MDDFEFSALVCAGVAIAVWLGGFGVAGPMGLAGALALGAVSLCGHFVISLLQKAGVSLGFAAGAYVVVLFLAYLACLLSFGAFASVLKFSFLPLALSAPAAASAVRGSII